MADMMPPAGADDFLTMAGWRGAQIAPLAGDASFRRYFRVNHNGKEAVLMDAPPPNEDVRPFVAMAEWLLGEGFFAPRILARDVDAGLLLIEDFGSRRMREAVDAGAALEARCYEAVVDVLVALADKTPPPGLKRHGLDMWLEEVALFTDWYCPAVGVEADRDAFQDAFRNVLTPIDAQGQTVVELRDYHAENVMLIGQGGEMRCGLLDFQDALIGHPAYDLVSMLQDARRDVPPAIERAMIDRYVTRTARGKDFEPAYWALGAQRNTRIIGLFVRLWQRDGKPHYLGFQKRMWGLLERDLAHPSLAPIAAWFDANIPADKRGAFWDKAER